MEEKTICPVETTLELIGGKYKALILWHLSSGKLRFSELRSRISGATPKMLTQQLRELESQQLVHRQVYPVIPPLKGTHMSVCSNRWLKALFSPCSH